MPSWFFASLRGYQIGWLPRDLVAGLMLAAIAIPGQLATARLAGMPPETGLCICCRITCLRCLRGEPLYVGRSRLHNCTNLCRGARIFVAGSPHYGELATLLALMVGAILVAVGLFRAGWLATLLSTPVTTGFLAGISIHIALGATVPAWSPRDWPACTPCASRRHGLHHADLSGGEHLSFGERPAGQ